MDTSASTKIVFVASAVHVFLISDAKVQVKCAVLVRSKKYLQKRWKIFKKSLISGRKPVSGLVFYCW